MRYISNTFLNYEVINNLILNTSGTVKLDTSDEVLEILSSLGFKLKENTCFEWVRNIRIWNIRKKSQVLSRINFNTYLVQNHDFYWLISNGNKKYSVFM